MTKYGRDDIDSHGWMDTQECDPPTAALVPARHRDHIWRWRNQTYHYYEERDNPACAGGSEYCKIVHDDGTVEWMEHFYAG